MRGHADNAGEAVTICLDQTGVVTLDRAAALLGIETTEARAALGTLVFEDPGSGDLVPAPRYLSGNVREKLNDAELVVLDDPRLAANVAALRAVIPDDLLPTEIDARPGGSPGSRISTWPPSSETCSAPPRWPPSTWR